MKRNTVNIIQKYKEERKELRKELMIKIFGQMEFIYVGMLVWYLILFPSLRAILKAMSIYSERLHIITVLLSYLIPFFIFGLFVKYCMNKRLCKDVTYSRYKGCKDFLFI